MGGSPDLEPHEGFSLLLLSPTCSPTGGNSPHVEPCILQGLFLLLLSHFWSPIGGGSPHVEPYEGGVSLLLMSSMWSPMGSYLFNWSHMNGYLCCC